MLFCRYQQLPAALTQRVVDHGPPTPPPSPPWWEEVVREVPADLTC